MKYILAYSHLVAENVAYRYRWGKERKDWLFIDEGGHYLRGTFQPEIIEIEGAQERRDYPQIVLFIKTRQPKEWKRVTGYE